MFNETNYIDKVDHAFIFIVVVSLILLIGTTGTMLYFVYKYNSKRNKKAVNIEGNLKLEIIWTVIPVVIVGFMFWYGYIGFIELATPPVDAMNVKVVGQMWKWTYEYDGGVTDTLLYVPVKQAVKLNLESTDVNHAFYVPSFRFKRDVMPNKNNTVWFRPDKVGEYQVECAEYCGNSHSNMYSKVVVLSQNDYDNWMETKLKSLKK